MEEDQIFEITVCPKREDQIMPNEKLCNVWAVTTVSKIAERNVVALTL